MDNANETFETVVLNNELEPLLRLYRRLWISRNDLHYAKASIESILKLNLRYPRRKEPEHLLVALTTTLVISYARPFVNSRGQSTIALRTVPATLLQVLTSRERSLHNAIIEMRNQEVAHSDAEVLELSVKLYPNGDGGISRATLYPLLRVELRMLNRIIKKLIDEIEFLCINLRKQLPLNVWL